MKVLLAHKFFHLTGGAEVFFFETARVLRAQGHEVAEFSTSDSRNKPSEWASYFVAAPEYKSGSFVKRVSGIQRMIYSSEAEQRFSELIDAFKPDVVHAFAINVHLSPSILVAAKRAGVPVVMSCNDYKHICPNYKLFHHGRICEECVGGKFYRAVVNRCCKNSLTYSVASAMEAYRHKSLGIYENCVDMFLFASRFMAEETARFWGGRDFSWGMLRNPFDSGKYELSSVDDRYALFFGRLVSEKGVDVLVRAAAQCPGLPVKVVGDGEESEALVGLAKSLGAANVEFCGPRWGEEIDKLIKGASFVVVPSVWHENFPYVINQAFAFGKPVVGSDRGGIPELVSDGERGLVYRADQPEALAEAMKALWSDQERCREMGRAAKAWSDAEFNDSMFYRRVIDIYEQVTANARSRTRR